MPNDDDILNELEDLSPAAEKKPVPERSPDAAPTESRTTNKVELDLEGAPFLEEEKPAEEKKEAPKPAASAAPGKVQMPPSGSDADAARQKRRKKLIMIAGAAGFGLLVVLGLVFFFLLRSPSNTPEAVAPAVSPAPSAPTAPGAHNAASEAAQGGNATLPAEPEIGLLAWDPFIIEKKDKDGKIVFLYAKFTASTEDLKLLSEMNAKKIVLRDAIFFYLSNKDLQYLSDSSKVDSLKRDLLSVINERLTKGELKEILIENYLVK